MAMYVRSIRMSKTLQRLHVLQNTNPLFILRRNYLTFQKEAKAWKQLLRKSGFENQTKGLQVLPNLIGYESLCANIAKRAISTSKISCKGNSNYDRDQNNDDDENEQKEKSLRVAKVITAAFLTAFMFIISYRNLFRNPRVPFLPSCSL